MAKEENEAQVLEEPGTDEVGEPESPWLRGVSMLIMAIMFKIAATILGLSAVIQFIWMVAKKETNQPIADFGTDLADWQARAARFLTGSTEDRPFPFAKWGVEQGAEQGQEKG